MIYLIKYEADVSKSHSMTGKIWNSQKRTWNFFWNLSKSIQNLICWIMTKENQIFLEHECLKFEISSSFIWLSRVTEIGLAVSFWWDGGSPRVFLVGLTMVFFHSYYWWSWRMCWLSFVRFVAWNGWRTVLIHFVPCWFLGRGCKLSLGTKDVLAWSDKFLMPFKIVLFCFEHKISMVKK